MQFATINNLGTKKVYRFSLKTFKIVLVMMEVKDK